MTERSAAAFPDIVEAIGVLFLWLVIVIRAVPALRRPNQRTMWVAVLCGALAMSLRIGPVYALVVDATGLSLGAYRDICADVIGLFAAAAIFTFVLNVVGWTGFSRLTYGSAVGVAAVLLVIDRFFDARTATGLSQHSTAGDLYWLILLAYHLVANFWCSYICLRCAPRTRSASLRAALLIFSVGTGMAGMLMVLSLIHFFTRIPAIVYFFPIVQGAEAFLYGMGTAVPLVAPAARAVRELLWLARIYPLWRDVTDSVEGVTLRNPGSYAAYLALSRADESYGLYRRIIEVQDAILTLYRYLLPAEREAAVEFVRSVGVRPVDLDAAVSACCIAAGVANKSEGRTPLPADDEHTRGDTDLLAEARLVSRISYFYRRPWPGDFAAAQRADVSATARG